MLVILKSCPSYGREVDSTNRSQDDEGLIVKGTRANKRPQYLNDYVTEEEDNETDL